MGDRRSRPNQDGFGGARPDERRIRVAVVFGGQSDEHDVSLRSALTVMGALDADRYDVVPIGITRDGRWLAGGDPMAALTAESPLFAIGAGGNAEPRSGATEALNGQVAMIPAAKTETPRGFAEALPAVIGQGIDVVFPVLHGPWGEDGTVQGLLELAGLPYVGSGVLGSSVAMDKAMAKTVLAQHGLPQGAWRLVTRTEWRQRPEMVADWIRDDLGFPCFVKPANLGSSVGISKVHDATELTTAMDVAAHYDRRIVVEAALDAREIELSVLGNDDPIASVAGEVRPCNEFYDYNAKYVDDGSELIIPADLSPETLAEAQRLAITAFQALDLAGLARVDFFLERTTGELFINEINTIPGFTSISMYPMLWEASGVPLGTLVERLVALAVERHGGV